MNNFKVGDKVKVYDRLCIHYGEIEYIRVWLGNEDLLTIKINDIDSWDFHYKQCEKIESGVEEKSECDFKVGDKVKFSQSPVFVVSREECEKIEEKPEPKCKLKPCKECEIYPMILTRDYLHCHDEFYRYICASCFKITQEGPYISDVRFSWNEMNS